MIRGSLTIVDDLGTASALKALSANQGLELFRGSLIHGLWNAKFTLSGTTLGLDVQSGVISSTNPTRIPMVLANGTLQWVNISTALSMTLPSGTFTRTNAMMGFTNTDGVATLTLSGNAVDVIIFVYVVYDSGTPYLAVSRSPFHTNCPPNYWHTPSASTITAVYTDTDTLATSTTSLAIGTGSKAFTIGVAGGTTIPGVIGLRNQFFVDPTRRVRAYSASGSSNFMEGTVTAWDGSTALTLNVDLVGGSGTKTDWNIAPRSFAYGWDDMIISKAGAISDVGFSAPCICLGPLCYGTISGSTGRFSAMALTQGEFPKWNNRQNPRRYKSADGTAPNGLLVHEIRVDTANGFGSTDTKIRKMTNNTISDGYAAQVLLAGGASIAGSIGGTEFVINEPGDYSGIFAEVVNAVNETGLSLDSVERTTGIATITVATKLCEQSTTGSGAFASSGFQQFLHAGSIVRLHTAGQASNGTPWAVIKKTGWGNAQ